MKQIPELTPTIRKMFEFFAKQYTLNVLSEKPKLAQIYTDKDNNPSTCILTWNHSIYIGGEFSHDCLNYISNKLLSSESKKNLHVFFIYYSNEAWKNSIYKLFADNCTLYERSLYSIKPIYNECFPQYDCIVEISEELMASTVSNLDMITEEIIGTGTYDNMEDFFIRGIGYTIIIDNKVCGFCTSEYQSEKEIAIGIEVLNIYQQRGYAKAMTNAFLNKSAQRDLNVYWECRRNNISSVKTAISCGFEKVADYSILFLKF